MVCHSCMFFTVDKVLCLYYRQVLIRTYQIMLKKTFCKIPSGCRHWIKRCSLLSNATMWYMWYVIYTISRGLRWKPSWISSIGLSPSPKEPSPDLYSENNPHSFSYEYKIPQMYAKCKRDWDVQWDILHERRACILCCFRSSELAAGQGGVVLCMTDQVCPPPRRAVERFIVVTHRGPPLQCCSTCNDISVRWVPFHRLTVTLDKGFRFGVYAHRYMCAIFSCLGLGWEGWWCHFFKPYSEQAHIELS